MCRSMPFRLPLAPRLSLFRWTQATLEVESKESSESPSDNFTPSLLALSIEKGTRRIEPEPGDCRGAMNAIRMGRSLHQALLFRYE
ncbi:hypothetical protein CT19431_MP110048 [Cupriavidus taiwanensis]|nr:hypothetical protein CT19431_MP110048 [Cupriavidus taiwanensis]